MASYAVQSSALWVHPASHTSRLIVLVCDASGRQGFFAGVTTGTGPGANPCAVASQAEQPAAPAEGPAPAAGDPTREDGNRAQPASIGPAVGPQPRPSVADEAPAVGPAAGLGPAVGAEPDSGKAASAVEVPSPGNVQNGAAVPISEEGMIGPQIGPQTGPGGPAQDTIGQHGLGDDAEVLVVQKVKRNRDADLRDVDDGRPKKQPLLSFGDDDDDT